MKKCVSAERKKNRAAHCQYVQPGRMSFRSLHTSALFRRLSTPVGRRVAGAVETFEEDYLRVVTMPNSLRRITQHTKDTGQMIDPVRPCLEFSKPRPVRELLKSTHTPFLQSNLRVVHGPTLRHVLCRSVSLPDDDCQNTECVFITCLFFYHRDDPVTGQPAPLS